MVRPRTCCPLKNEPCYGLTPGPCAQKNVVTLVPSTRDVMRGTRILEPKFAQHAAQNRMNQTCVKPNLRSFLRSDSAHAVH